MSATRPFLCMLLPALLLFGLADCQSQPASKSNPWLSGISNLLQDCPRSRQTSSGARLLGSLARCARRRALAAIDRILEDDTVPIVSGLELVKYQRLEFDSSSSSSSSRQRLINNSVTFDIRDLLKGIRERDYWLLSKGGKAALEEKQEEDAGGWRAKLIKRLARVLKTHVIKIDMERLLWPRYNSTAVAPDAGQVESRGRRRRRRQMQMMPIIMMGVLLMGSVLIPMGFQFLAVLGGKALILAKMALMLSSIQGLKKIATNGVNYGLYHSPVPEPWHERSTAGVELPSYALNYATGAAGYSLPAAAGAGYLDPASLGYLANRRSASAAVQSLEA